ncbi:MAG: hypothetical protein PGN11_02595 [Quadrisphaera sp.]
MIQVGRRTKNQPAPPWAVFEALVDPHRDPARPWLALLHDEVEPEVLEQDEPRLVEEPPPDPALAGHLCKRLNQLINAELRYSFGQ